MNIFFRGIIIGVGVGLGLAPFVLFAEASTYQTTLAECQKRTGLSAGLCKGLIKKNLNVESCKKQAGLSDAECAKRIEEIKNDPEFSGFAIPVNAPTNTNTSSNPTARPMSAEEEEIRELRIKKERQLAELQSRTKALINFLKEKGTDVTVVEKNLGEFEKKSEELLLAYDAFQSTYVDTLDDPDYVKTAIREQSREIVSRSRNSLVEYYRTNIFDPLRTAYQQTL